MTKREEMAGILKQPIKVDLLGAKVKGFKGIKPSSNKRADEILAYLHSQGVVIKVDREYPSWDGKSRIVPFPRYEYEPLIEE